MPYINLEIPGGSANDTLEAREYQCSNPVAFAIVSHPYSLLGGSQDDPVVTAMAETLAKSHIVTLTFDFRSPTSWTAVRERRDYCRTARYGCTKYPALDTLYCCAYSYGTLCLPALSDLNHLIERRLRVKYIVVSPLLPPLSTILTLSLEDKYAHVKLCPHLTIWGQHDNFTASSRLQKAWRAHGVMVPGATHFWKSHESMDALKEQIDRFLIES